MLLFCSDVTWVWWVSPPPPPSYEEGSPEWRPPASPSAAARNWAARTRSETHQLTSHHPATRAPDHDWRGFTVTHRLSPDQRNTVCRWTASISWRSHENWFHNWLLFTDTPYLHSFHFPDRNSEQDFPMPCK